MSSNLSISVSYKDDLYNLIEWLEYHLIVGVQHFYIYNNDKNPYTAQSILQPYMNEGVVTMVHSAKMFTRPRVNRQADAHHHCLQRSRGKTRWLAMLDMDEFLYPLKTDNINDVLKDYEAYPQLLINYCCFGSSGIKRKQDFQTQSYVNRAKDNWRWNHLCKGIGQVDKIKNCLHHHCFAVAGVDENKKACNWVKPYSGKILRINHYLTRSQDDYHQKMLRGNPLGEKRDWNWFNWANRNEVYDDGIWVRFGERIMASINRKKKIWNKSKERIMVL